MTKQEAIQHQIDNIMDTFDFKKVKSIMRYLKWKWNDEESSPDEYEIRSHARHCLKEAAKNAGYATGGFQAYKVEGRDENGPWVRLSLSFGLETFEDGTAYEEEKASK
jgi:hypothetical protein